MLGRQNPLLREFFRKEYLGIRSEELSPPDSFVEKFVDMRIDDFLERLRKDMDQLAGDCRKLSEIRLEPESRGEAMNIRRIELGPLLENLEKNSDELRRSVSRILVDLESKGDFRLSPRPGEPDFQLVEALDVIQSKTEKALRELEEFFFSAGVVVHLQDLQNQNMLTHLHEVRQIAREIRKSL